MNNPRNNHPHPAGERKSRNVSGRASSGAGVRPFPLCVLVLSLCFGLLGRQAIAQLVRGTPIDSPPATLPATNEPPSKQTPTNALPANKNEVPKGFHRLPFNPAAQPGSLSNREPGVKSALSNPSQTSGTLPEMKGGYLAAGFDKLSAFPADVILKPEGWEMVGQIPDDVKSLDGKAVFIKGFMIPLNHLNGLTTDCLLLKSQAMCCFGIQPKINEWVLVRLTGKGIEAIRDRPVTIFGKLHVGEYRENGRLRSIYRMDGERMERPEESR